jgi:hypothetical protein
MYCTRRYGHDFTVLEREEGRPYSSPMPFEHVLPVHYAAPENIAYALASDYSKLYRHDANRLWVERIGTAWAQLPSFVYEVSCTSVCAALVRMGACLCHGVQRV